TGGRSSKTQHAGGRTAHDLPQTVLVQEATVLLDPGARLPVRAEAILEGHVGAPEQVVGTDAIDHRFEGRPDLTVGEVEEVAESDRKAHLEIAPRVLERLPDRVGEGDAIHLEEAPPGE